LAKAFREKLGLTEMYLADLDAISGSPPALPLYRALNDSGSTLWVDAGLRDAERAEELLDAGVSTLVAGLETLPGPAALASLIRRVGPERSVFSLDLRDGRALTAPDSDWSCEEPWMLAEIAFQAGARRILLLDLARVGTGSGVGTAALLLLLLERLAWGEVSVGGGISGPGDLIPLEMAGASAVLIGSALHDGRIGLRGNGPADPSR
jgi:phosphoribosylformimino-5-aminoimidazole carboxamide ribotide isomerase